MTIVTWPRWLLFQTPITAINPFHHCATIPLVVLGTYIWVIYEGYYAHEVSISPDSCTSTSSLICCHALRTRFAFLAASLVLVPLPWHWRARNVATLSMIVWLFAVNIIYGVDALLWSGNVEVVAPVRCDISKFLPLATLPCTHTWCLCHR